MTTLREAAQQALEALEDYKYAEARDALRAALAEPVLQTCNCRWDGEVQVQQCTLHEAHVDAIHEWAERAKTAEKKLAALAEPVQKPVAWGVFDGPNLHDVNFTNKAIEEAAKYAASEGNDVLADSIGELKI